VVGMERRSIQDEELIARQEELAFLRRLKENALRSLALLRHRSGSTSSLSPRR